MKREMVGGAPGNVLGMLADLLHKLQHGVIAPEELEKFLKRQNPFGKTLYIGWILSWKDFYHDVFGLKLDFSNISISKYQKDFDRLIIMTEGMTPQKLYDKCAELFQCRKYTNRNLDEAITSDRTAQNGAYTVWFRDRQEADEELKNLSANCLRERNISGITLEERLLFELKYFKETKGHLDIQNVTLCSGSRCVVGLAPLVGWGGDKLNVDWCSLDGASGNLRARQAVS
jgi:hypothetical protein